MRAAVAKQWVVVAVALTALAGGARQGAAQQTVPDTARTPQEVILDRLRNLRPLGAPDSVVNRDSVRAEPQQIRVNENRQRGGERAPGLARDSVWDAMLELEGLLVTEYRGDSARFGADSSNFRLHGNALVVRDGQQIEADLINYSGTATLWCGYGSPRITGVGESAMQSDSLCYDVGRGSAVARGVTTSISEGAVWRMYSTTLVTRGDRYYSHDAIFTDCDEPWDHVHYAFEADQVLAVHNNVLVARDVTLRFADVPVFWLPFMVQSLSQGRRSGVLMPRFGINDIARTSSRYNRRIEDVGFYWAISDYMGAEVAMDWMSNNYTALRASYDYNFLQQFLRGGITAKRFWKDEGGSELTVASQNSWEPNERTRMNANVNYSTSSEFVRQRTFDPRELNRSINSTFSLNRRLDWGSVTIGSSRKQFLSDNTVTQVFPNASATLSSLTLFEALPGEEKWYSNATLTGGGEVTRDGMTVGDANTNPNTQSRQQFRGSVYSTFSLGNFSIKENFSTNDSRYDLRTLTLEERDTTIVLPERTERANRWDVGINYKQTLIGSTAITPSLTLRGETLRNERSGDALVASPVTLDFGATLHSDIYGLWPGVGPFERMRHKISPSISYAYAPRPTADSLQSAVFSGLDNIRERNTISFGVNQTFEAKLPETRDSAQLAAAAAADSANADAGPTRRAGARTVTLLSINTSALAYDFVQAREAGEGFTNPTLTNSIRSDLIPGLDVSITHDLFRELPREEGAPPAQEAEREFAPYLSDMTARMSFNSGSWLFRWLGFGRGDSAAVAQDALDSEDFNAEGGVAVDRTREELGVVGTNRSGPVGAPRGQTGTWSANVDYALTRPRPDDVQGNDFGFGSVENQMLGGSLNFYPTEHWSAQWLTRYSVTDGAFANHQMTLTRRLHDWDAHFDFIKAQNGNFSFQFRVNLRANPDVKLDYSQRDLVAPETRSRLR